jgi:hypothetical protein
VCLVEPLEATRDEGADGSINVRGVSTCDSAGNLVKHEVDLNADGQVDLRWVYTVDAIGNYLTKTEQRLTVDEDTVVAVIANMTGVPLSRTAERELIGLLPQEPPRRTRSLPESGPPGLSAGGAA